MPETWAAQQMGEDHTRRRFLTGLALSGAGLAFRAPSASAACATPLRFAHGEDRRPISWVGDKGAPHGLKVDILNLLSTASGICLRHECMPWARALQCVYSDVADGVMAVPSIERSKLIHFAEVPLMEDEARFYYSRDNPRAAEIATIRTIDDMRRFKITDSIAGAWSSVNATELILDLVPNQQIAFRKLISGRTDIAIINRLTARTVMRAVGAGDGFDWTPAPINPGSQFRIGLRRNLSGCGELLARFDAAARKPEMRNAMSAAVAKYL